jgi:hypothetical protein
MTTFYAWTDITVPNKVVEGSFVTIPVGKEVSKSDIGKDWDDFLAAGVIRTTPFPKDILTSESPRNAILRKANEMMKKASEPYKHELEA